MRADPFAYARRQGVRVARIPGARRWLTFNYGGTVCVAVNSKLSRTEQRRALAEALLAQPVFGERVSRS